MSNLDRRTFLAGAAATAAAFALPGGTNAYADTTFLPYTADSFFKSKVLGAPVDATATTTFRSFMKTHPDQKAYSYPVIKGVGSNKWGTVFAESSPTDPIWKLTGSGINAKCNILKTQGFRAPANFGQRLTGTSDSPFAVLDATNGYTVFGTNAKVVAPYTISVGSAGVTYHSSNGLDYRNPRSNDTRNFTSRGRISDSMVIRKSVADAGVAGTGDLGHVLHIFLCETLTSAGFCHPMTGTESGKNGFGAEGLRIAIRPDKDLSTAVLSPYGRVVANTLQRYGGIIGDNAGGATSIKAQQESTLAPVWGTSLKADALKGAVTWDDFIVLPKGWQ